MHHKNKLYWKIAGILFGLVVVLGVAYLLITRYTAQQYLQEMNQRLYGDLAEHTVQEVKPLIDGQVDTLAIQKIMHSMMIINPSVEVYLLDTEGGIITYVAPYKRVQLDRVGLEPILEYIAAEEKPFIKGDDPRNPGAKKVFSAAPLEEKGKVEGYLYIVLASEIEQAVATNLYGSYMLSLGAKVFFVTATVALLLGLWAIWYLTKNLGEIVRTVRRLKEGDLAVRFAKAEQGEFADVKLTFNEMAETIKRNIEELKSVESLRRELIANVSHDLRTPLAIMQGYVETMLMKEEQLTPEERRRYLETVLSSSESLSNLISQLFEYSKLEARQVEPQKEPFLISELAQDVYQKYQILARRRKIEMKLDIEPNLPLVFADLALVERVIQNLMDNALNYTPEGGSVYISMRALDEKVEVKIADTGPGIPEDEQSYIFERYKKASRTGKKSKGAGLGLAIVKKILELHNSTISVSSRLSEGTTFRFDLPTSQNVQYAM